jgi:two-component system response regulator FixJ
VHVVDDDEAMRSSIAFLLESAGLAVKTYDSAQGFLAGADQLDGGCVVTDIRMPGMSGLDLVRRLAGQGIVIPVIVVTGHGDVALAVEAMKGGVVDFIEKPFDDEVLLSAINTALARGGAGKERHEESRKFREVLGGLSPREKDVLAGLVAGKANKVIAYDLSISPRTVEIYRANVMTKTGAGSLSELVRMALLAEL